MPPFNGAANSLTTTAGPGDSPALFATSDSVTAPVFSRVIAIYRAAPPGVKQVAFQTQFATAPTAVVEIFGSNTPPTSAGPQNGILLYTSTNKQSDSYIDTSGFAFYWAELVSQSGGGALSVQAQVG